MRLSSMIRYRPSRVSDGGGGFSEVAGDPATFFGAVQIHAGEPVLTIREGSPVLPMDLIEVEDEFYRVIALRGPAGAPFKTATMEKVSRPIVPRPAGLS